MHRWRGRREGWREAKLAEREAAAKEWESYDYAAAVIRVAAAVAAGRRVEPEELASSPVVEWVADMMRMAGSLEDLVVWQREIERDPHDPDIRRLVHGMQQRVIQALRDPDSVELIKRSRRRRS